MPLRQGLQELDRATQRSSKRQNRTALDPLKRGQGCHRAQQILTLDIRRACQTRPKGLKPQASSCRAEGYSGHKPHGGVTVLDARCVNCGRLAADAIVAADLASLSRACCPDTARQMRLRRRQELEPAQPNLTASESLLQRQRWRKLVRKLGSQKVRTQTPASHTYNCSTSALRMNNTWVTL